MIVQRLLIVILSVGLMLAPCAFAQKAGQAPDALARFQQALESDGFEVNPGAAQFFNIVEQWCAGTVDNALYANNEPYVQVMVPESAEQPEKLGIDFQLRSDEAVVLIGLTPPPARYFSYSPYLWSRLYPDGSRRPIFATLGDSVNNATVRTIGPSPFNAPMVLIFTPDEGTDARVRAALRHAGYPAATIDTIVFPASMLRLGLDDTADWLRIVLRNALWQDQDAGDAYIENLPLKVFRLTPRTPATEKPFPAPPLRVRGTGRTEMGLTHTLAELRDGIVAANPAYQAEDILTMPMCYEGYDLIQRGNIELCGDSRDAFYVGSGIPQFDAFNQITLADGEFLMLYGVNHVATGKAAYMNTNIYASESAHLTLGNINDTVFPGTATPYLPGNPEADKMYAYKVSRDCGGEANCLQLAAPDGCSRMIIDANTLLGVFTRIYLEPATKVGPAMPEMLYDRVIKFSPRP